MDFNCDFQIEIKIWQSEIGNLDRGKFKNIEKIGNLGRTFREKRLEIWKKNIEIWENFHNLEEIWGEKIEILEKNLEV